MSLFDTTMALKRVQQRKELALLAASKGAIERLDALTTRLTALGWKPTPHVTSDALAGVGLVIWLNVASHARLAELLAQLQGLDIAFARDDRLVLGDCHGYILTLGDATRITLRVGVTHALKAVA